MTIANDIQPRPYRAWLRHHIDEIPQLQGLTEHQRTVMKAVSAVFPFRVNSFVVEELIDWNDIPNDPIYQLTFPQEGMLDGHDRDLMLRLVSGGASREAIQTAARRIQRAHNPHPAGQLDLNVPQLEGQAIEGMQHKYRETVLFFPSQGQTCHAYCTYCFRWAQFVGLDHLKQANREADVLAQYLREHEEVRSLLVTGGDPLVMKAKILRRYIEPLLEPGCEHVTSIRLGTKALTYWPYRFLTDPDADELLELFEEVVAAGKHLAFMAHVTHPRELEPELTRRALARVRATGATVRCQAPVVRHVNDDADTWAELWKTQVALGAVPYYMFVERDTGPKRYFEVPLHRTFEIFTDALRQVSGLERTVRGPSMSATLGKVLIDGFTHVDGQKLFVLKFLQARDPDWIGRVFFAEYDERATWLDDLRPAFGDERFFFESHTHPHHPQHRQRRQFLRGPVADVLPT